jgi:hypothetical protein
MDLAIGEPFSAGATRLAGGIEGPPASQIAPGLNGLDAFLWASQGRIYTEMHRSYDGAFVRLAAIWQRHVVRVRHNFDCGVGGDTDRNSLAQR